MLFNILGYAGERIEFESKSGVLSVSRNNDWLVLNFPAQPPTPCDTPPEIVEAFGTTPSECLKHEDYLVIFDTAEEVQTAAPEMEILKKLDGRGVIISAPSSNEHDFIVRFFAPKYGIPEDPVTGSAYTQLVPYWAKRMHKNKFHARQISKRGGELLCELSGDRVLISGKAVKYLEGTLEIDT